MKARKLSAMFFMMFAFGIGCFGAGWSVRGMRDVSKNTTGADYVSEMESVSDTEPATEADPWDGFMDRGGFVSNEEAYGMPRSKWQERFGAPDMSQSTYYKDFVSDIYYYYAPDGSWGRVLELSFDADVLNSDPKPSSIRMTDLTNELLSGRDDLKSLFSGGTLGITKEFAGKSLDEVLEILGEPLVSLDEPWGYATWQLTEKELMVHLDEDKRVLCVDVNSVWEDVVGEEESMDSGQDLESESEESVDPTESLE